MIRLNNMFQPSLYKSCVIGTALILLVLGAVLSTDHQPAPVAKPARYSPSRSARPVAATPKPASLPATDLPPLQNCGQGTVVTVIAHEDDDLLFMNPRIDTDLVEGRCMRTIYLTAGDDGLDATYWQGREAGAQSAYSTMLSNYDGWQTSSIRIGEQRVVYASPVGNASVGLLFFRLPDGGLDGGGFASTGYQSLTQLSRTPGRSITSVDGQASYTRAQLIAALGTVMQLDKPIQVYTQQVPGPEVSRDHADHGATGQLAAEAWHSVYLPGPLVHFIGYATGHMPTNLSDAEVARKQEIFAAYQYNDAAICNYAQGCNNSGTYTNYLSRMYTADSQSDRR